MDKKLQVVRETLAPGASVSIVARRHDINTNIVFRWRRQYMRGELVKGAAEAGKPRLPPAFAPVDVVDDAGAVPALLGPQRQEVAPHGAMEREPAEAGVIEIETAAGVKVRVSGRVDDRALGLVLAEIRRRS